MVSPDSTTGPLLPRRPPCRPAAALVHWALLCVVASAGAALARTPLGSAGESAPAPPSARLLASLVLLVLLAAIALVTFWTAMRVGGRTFRAWLARERSRPTPYVDAWRAYRLPTDVRRDDNTGAAPDAGPDTT